MQYIYQLLFCLLIVSNTYAQDCGKAWMHYERRVELSQIAEERFSVKIPIEKIQVDFLGAPIGVPFNYTVEQYSPYSDHVAFKGNKKLLLHKDACQSLEQMQNAAKASDIELSVNNSYRSYSHQKHLHHKLGGHQAEKPGYSEHHLATAVDLENITDQKFLWLLRNGFDFGWVPSYYFREGTNIKKEAWHWRYVGKLAASKFRCAWELEINRCIWKLKTK